MSDYEEEAARRQADEALRRAIEDSNRIQRQLDDQRQLAEQLENSRRLSDQYYQEEVVRRSQDMQREAEEARRRVDDAVRAAGAENRVRYVDVRDAPREDPRGQEYRWEQDRQNAERSERKDREFREQQVRDAADQRERQYTQQLLEDQFARARSDDDRRAEEIRATE